MRRCAKTYIYPVPCAVMAKSVNVNPFFYSHFHLFHHRSLFLCIYPVSVSCKNAMPNRHRQPNWAEKLNKRQIRWNFPTEPENQITDDLLDFCARFQSRCASWFWYGVSHFFDLTFAWCVCARVITTLMTGLGSGRNVSGEGITDQFHQINLRTIWNG